jgi:hypothetical protein
MISGFSMEAARMYAIPIGDTSGTFIHPAMITASELLGFVLWQEQQGQFSLMTEEYLLRLTKDSLADLERRRMQQGFNSDTFCTSMQVYCTIALYHFLGRRVPEFREQLRCAFDLVQLVGLEHIITSMMATPLDPSLMDAASYSESRNPQEGKKLPVPESLSPDVPP